MMRLCWISITAWFSSMSLNILEFENGANYHSLSHSFFPCTLLTQTSSICGKIMQIHISNAKCMSHLLKTYTSLKKVNGLSHFNAWTKLISFISKLFVWFCAFWSKTSYTTGTFVKKYSLKRLFNRDNNKAIAVWNKYSKVVKAKYQSAYYLLTKCLLPECLSPKCLLSNCITSNVC